MNFAPRVGSNYRLPISPWVCSLAPSRRFAVFPAAMHEPRISHRCRHHNIYKL